MEIQGMSPECYAALWGSTETQAKAHFYNYGAETQARDQEFYRQFLYGPGGLADTVEAVEADRRAKEGRWEPEDLEGIRELKEHVEGQYEDLMFRVGCCDGCTEKGKAKTERPCSLCMLWEQDPDDEPGEREDRHSANCYFCGVLFDEREGAPADELNGGAGGDACPKCLKERARRDEE